MGIEINGNVDDDKGNGKLQIKSNFSMEESLGVDGKEWSKTDGH